MTRLNQALTAQDNSYRSLVNGCKCVLLAALYSFAGPASAQSSPVNSSAAESGGGEANDLTAASRTADTGAGQVGQRQTTSDVAPNVLPTMRIENRIDNRIANRISNRIDRNYEGDSSQTSSVERAQKRSRNLQRSAQPQQ